MKPTILALDLEGTLISNAVSQIPRPGLHRFLEDVRSQFEELVLFTTVPRHLQEELPDSWLGKAVFRHGLSSFDTSTGLEGQRIFPMSPPTWVKPFSWMTMAPMCMMGRRDCGSRSRCSAPRTRQTMTGCRSQLNA